MSNRVVLDTNILVAAAYAPDSASRRIVEACLHGELTAVLSSALRKEYEYIIARALPGRAYADRLQALLDRAELVEPAETPRVVPDDPEDDKVVAVAQAGDAVIVTNDRHLLVLADGGEIRVSRPAELVRLLDLPPAG